MRWTGILITGKMSLGLALNSPRRRTIRISRSLPAYLHLSHSFYGRYVHDHWRIPFFFFFGRLPTFFSTRMMAGATDGKEEKGARDRMGDIFLTPCRVDIQGLTSSIRRSRRNIYLGCLSSSDSKFVVVSYSIRCGQLKGSSAPVS